jgi:hypothetical protein
MVALFKPKACMYASTTSTTQMGVVQVSELHGLWKPTLAVVNLARGEPANQIKPQLEVQFSST